MSERFTLEQIHEYWKQQAATHKQSQSASWSDVRMIEMEIREINKYLVDGDKVLDVGCGNGFSTAQFVADKNIDVLGVDYVAAMIEAAETTLNELKDGLRGRIKFAVADVFDLNLQDQSFDKVTSIRLIINLGDWPSQLRGLRECLRVLKPGGLLLLSEATVGGWQRMNSLRREWRLPDIPMPSFNNYLHEDKIVSSLLSQADLQEILNFSSTYYVGTRVLKPLFAQACKADIDIADPLMEWNRWFSQLPTAGNYGTQKLFIFRKKSKNID